MCIVLVRALASLIRSSDATQLTWGNSFISFEGQLCIFAWVLSLLGRYFHYLLVKNATVFMVWWRHTHSDWQCTETFLYVIGKSNIMYCYCNLRSIQCSNCLHVIDISANKGTLTNLNFRKDAIDTSSFLSIHVLQFVIKSQCKWTCSRIYSFTRAFVCPSHHLEIIGFYIVWKLMHSS